MSKRTKILEEFEDYIAMVYEGQELSIQQLTEIKRSFFGGFSIALSVLSEIDSVEGEDFEAKVLNLYAEAQRFVTDEILK